MNDDGNNAVLLTLDETVMLSPSLDLLAIADRMFAYYLCSEYSQSYELYQYVDSLPNVMMSVGSSDINEIIRKITLSIKRYYSTVFDDVEVEVTENTKTVDKTNTILNIYLGLAYKGETVNLNRIVTYGAYTKRVYENE